MWLSVCICLSVYLFVLSVCGCVDGWLTRWVGGCVSVCLCEWL